MMLTQKGLRSTYTLPTLCAACGEAEGTIVAHIKRRTIFPNPLSLLTIFLPISMIHWHVYDYTLRVPLCDECTIMLANKKRRRNMALTLLTLAICTILLGIFFWGGLSYSEIILIDSSVLALIQAFIGLMIFSIPACIVFLWLNRDNIGTFNGRYYQFKNVAFMREFAQLNPDRIRKRKKTPYDYDPSP